MLGWLFNLIVITENKNVLILSSNKIKRLKQNHLFNKQSQYLNIELLNSSDYILSA